MEYLSNLDFIAELAHDITKSRNTPYSNYTPERPDWKLSDMKVRDAKSGRDLRAFLYENSGTTRCIVYLHGLSSCSAEGRYLIDHLKGTMSLCLFDFEGHGKSKGEIVSYGLNEKGNLYSVMRELLVRGYTDIILWGRSMGAVTALLFMRDPTYRKISQQVKFLVLDSPFSSFRRIVKQLASKRLDLPHFLLQMLVQLIRNNILKKYNLDLFKVDLTDCSKIQTPALFITSKQDEVVSYQHSQLIYNKFGGEKDKMYIDSGHNQQRGSKCMSVIMGKVRKAMGIGEVRERRGISIYSSKEIISLQTVPSEKYLTTVASQPQLRPYQSHQHLCNIAYL